MSAEFDLIPEHLKDNYRALVAERHDGDWSRLAREMEAAGESLLAKWAASHTDAKPKAERAVDRAPRTTRGKASA